MHLAGRVADDERRSRIRLRLGDGLDRLRRLRAHGDLRHVHVAVLHGDFGKTLLGNVLARRRELRNLADVGRL